MPSFAKEESDWKRKDRENPSAWWRPVAFQTNRVQSPSVVDKFWAV